MYSEKPGLRTLTLRALGSARPLVVLAFVAAGFATAFAAGLVADFVAGLVALVAGFLAAAFALVAGVVPVTAYKDISSEEERETG